MDLVWKAVTVVAKYAWALWPALIVMDVGLSAFLMPGSSRSAWVRWVPRAAHAFVLAAFMSCMGMWFFVDVVLDQGYYPGGEYLLVGPLVFYISIRLAQRFDKVAQRSTHWGALSKYWWLLFAGSFILLVALSSLESVTDAFPGQRLLVLSVYILVVLVFVALGTMEITGSHRLSLFGNVGLCAISLMFNLFCYAGANYSFLGPVHWTRTGDNIWGSSLAALILSAMLALSSVVRSIAVYGRGLSPERRFDESFPQSGVAGMDVKGEKR